MAKILKSGTHKGIKYTANQEISDDLVTNDLIRAGFVGGVIEEVKKTEPKKPRKTKKAKKKEEKEELENADNILLTDTTSDVNIEINEDSDEDSEEEVKEDDKPKKSWFNR